MIGKKAIVVMITLTMLVSGLGILSVGMNPEPVDEPRSVQRVVLVEDFTEWGCPPCFDTNPDWCAAVENLGYGVVAPAMVHVWWPITTDPIFWYNEAENRQDIMDYGVSGVPDRYVDGAQIVWSQVQAGFESDFLARSSVPSPMTIETQGWLDGIGLSGEITVGITAVDALLAADYRIYIQLWENNITRLVNPNGETENKWAVWDHVPTADGEQIFQLGAAIDDYAEFTYPFNLESDWVINEMGATIFVQDFATKEVHQASVQLFDNEAPDVTIVTPTGAAEQILGGTIPIEWTATDLEDVDATLDISIDYSPDGGASWINIMTGTDNNIAPYTFNWDTVAGAIPDGTGYLIKITAWDSGGNRGNPISAEAFSIDNTLDDEWFLQVETAGANMDLDMKPVELTLNEAPTS